MATLPKSLLLVNLAATLMMVGLIWFVQIVHYPLFEHAEGPQFKALARDHQRLTTWVVAPLMITELVTAAALIYWRPPNIGNASTLLAFAIVVLIWLITYLVQVPQHEVLSSGYDQQVVRELVRENWWRTAAWSCRGLLVLSMVYRAGRMDA
ncbi:MAG: hypothetical protein GTO53_08960 [Planctomycetales bacterium]|nr:hypothetical protein [Planctomycetales bacterium]NIM09256.1 hypothetical protein [Planctomycetales bacterium]NIN08724.1 hypothetical protein [Planctomycetales bacterium]NIN77842.1 hypothetical protein [Planctomycetales bacterium]NIO35026.1 hypothetical protein [Planctomycetales bacterium]